MKPTTLRSTVDVAQPAEEKAPEGARPGQEKAPEPALAR